METGFGEVVLVDRLLRDLLPLPFVHNLCARHPLDESPLLLAEAGNHAIENTQRVTCVADSFSDGVYERLSKARVFPFRSHQTDTGYHTTERAPAESQLRARPNTPSPATG